MNGYFSINKKLMSGALLASSLILSACSDNDSKQDDMLEFEVTVSNLTAGQPLSPAAVLLHDSQWKSFQTGHRASDELELLAEGGDNSLFLSSSLDDSYVYLAESGAGIIAPGEYESFQVQTSEKYLGTLSLSVVSMLVNSNDAIAALNGKAISALEIDESMSFELLTYDTGTEANTETADTIPGPAAQGGDREGFNVARDDVRDAVYLHPGVVTQDDGLSSSTLGEVHRWDNPAVGVRVERIR
ncbi:MULTISPECIES: spondin domain-containing protein [unclassified Oleiphilus]|uniref:spondin domain-containing protein n=2 Tax=Oleiphilus TaxID=141450 RepID=UPI0007C2CDA3|nr:MULTISPECIES: spondin domain-containing protein [unclassified Oleiphilus]KZY75736.1 hypothetical protein A3740_14595 [Oleiphilus sp. HI0068]KZY80754.1 hypothetical protein A3741_00660 [Oleiphilus sp. HI0069]KZY89960.1 hypothetical protein A3743_00785 [Oleiphilus sp. HI0072]KZZ20361.1 hypothetical protein A3749_03225 [Oleiphilus sp. HI0078]KZZ23378.1 hypothetical protein A3752_05595 [Oleiphilus sp. HI0081]KZZ34176.1 hypothetical protein A3755_06460 [Oleiphilus sp. HI0085]